MTEIQSIHDFDRELICEYFAGLERQGPGSPDVTHRALSFIDGLKEGSRIADIGCGTGGQTMVLAQRAPGKITGIDLFPQFIDLFNQNAKQMGLYGKVRGMSNAYTENIKNTMGMSSTLGRNDSWYEVR